MHPHQLHTKASRPSPPWAAYSTCQRCCLPAPKSCSTPAVPALLLLPEVGCICKKANLRSCPVAMPTHVLAILPVEHANRQSTDVPIPGPYKFAQKNGGLVRGEGNENTPPAWPSFNQQHCMCPGDPREEREESSLRQALHFRLKAMGTFSRASVPKIPQPQKRPACILEH